MKSTQRGRARSRLAKGVLTENVIFSNGLGVCRLVPGAGQQSVCRRRTRNTNQYIRLNVFQNISSPYSTNSPYGPTVHVIINSNIVGAAITISHTANGETLTLTAPANAISVAGYQSLVLTPSSQIVDYNGIQIILTGGNLSTGYPHSTSSIALNSIFYAPFFNPIDPFTNTYADASNNRVFTKVGDIGYTLSEACTTGTATYTWTSGNADVLSPHIVQLAAPGELTLGAHARGNVDQQPNSY